MPRVSFVAPDCDHGHRRGAHPAAPENRAASFTLFWGALTGAESMLVCVAVPGGVAAWMAIGAHFVLIAGAAYWLSRRPPADHLALWSIGLLAVSLSGPLGALGVLALAYAERRTTLSGDLLDEWYKRMSGNHAPDPASVIHEAIVTDRTIRLNAGGFRRFHDLMVNGALSEKQALLGLIGLKYHSDYFPLLGLALRSREASVRAQAAAVFVKLKQQFKSRLASNLALASSSAPPLGANAALTCASAIFDCSESGFIDGSEVRNARKVVAALCEKALAAGAETDRAEELLCRVLASSAEHQQIARRLSFRGPNLTSELKLLLANSMIALNQHRELTSLLASLNSEERPAFRPCDTVGATAC